MVTEAFCKDWFCTISGCLRAGFCSLFFPHCLPISSWHIVALANLLSPVGLVLEREKEYCDGCKGYTVSTVVGSDNPTSLSGTDRKWGSKEIKACWGMGESREIG